MKNHVLSIIGNDSDRYSREKLLEFVEYLNDGYRIINSVNSGNAVQYVLEKEIRMTKKVLPLPQEKTWLKEEKQEFNEAL